MKKLLLAIFAAAALFSCSKSNITYDNPSEIAFAPYAKKATKAAVAGTIYPTTLDMYVFANAGTGNDMSTYEEPYFQNALFEDNENDGVFAGTPAYYWPNVKSLIFSGLSASGNVSKTTQTFTFNENACAWQINLTGYAPGNGINNNANNDLMWFSPEKPYSKADVPGSADDTPNANGDNDIEVTMKHACAWITINIKGDDITGATGTTWNIKSLKLTSLSTSGNAELGTSAYWPLDKLSKAISVTLHENSNTDASEMNYLTTEYVDYTTRDQKINNTDVTINGAKFNSLIVIPQSVCNLEIEYSFVSQTGLDPITEIKSIPLTHTIENSESQPWAAGIHYTYNITIGTKQILIEPSVTDWTPKTVADVII